MKLYEWQSARNAFNDGNYAKSLRLFSASGILYWPSETKLKSIEHKDFIGKAVHFVRYLTFSNTMLRPTQTLIAAADLEDLIAGVSGPSAEAAKRSAKLRRTFTARATLRPSLLHGAKRLCLFRLFRRYLSQVRSIDDLHRADAVTSYMLNQGSQSKNEAQMTIELRGAMLHELLFGALEDVEMQK
ncbi:hypothetical protein B0H12DRAFT_1079879 [Mycena haematopus]|nr:hypothetical protein B0H12DRAFT_1079879 [Mycena haematopus]